MWHIEVLLTLYIFRLAAGVEAVFRMRSRVGEAGVPPRRSRHGYHAAHRFFSSWVGRRRRPTPITTAWEGEDAASLGGACEPQWWIGKEEGVGIGEDEGVGMGSDGDWGRKRYGFFGLAFVDCRFDRIL
jgi:hypothetical protein